MNVQFKKGALELCVLTLLRQGEKYGYELAEAISGEISISEGTIYPILRRLRNEGYYRLTQKGIQTQEELYAEWMEFSQQVNHLIGGIQYDEK